MNFTVTDGQGNSITDFELQGLNLIFKPGMVSANEKITVRVSDPGGEYLSSAPVTVTLNSDSIGSAAITLTQKGSLRLGMVTGCEATASLFDAQGRNIWITSAQAMQTSEPLDAGTYTLVFLQKNNLLRSADRLSLLDSLGLTAGTDYLKMQVTITDGKINRLDECVVPKLDESRLSCTIADKTSVSVSKASGLAPGELFMVRVTYALDPEKNVSARSLQVVLPEGVEPSADRIALMNNAPATYSYDASARTITSAYREKRKQKCICTVRPALRRGITA